MSGQGYQIVADTFERQGRVRGRPRLLAASDRDRSDQPDPAAAQGTGLDSRSAVTRKVTRSSTRSSTASGTTCGSNVVYQAQDLSARGKQHRLTRRAAGSAVLSSRDRRRARAFVLRQVPVEPGPRAVSGARAGDRAHLRRQEPPRHGADRYGKTLMAKAALHAAVGRGQRAIYTTRCVR